MDDELRYLRQRDSGSLPWALDTPLHIVRQLDLHTEATDDAVTLVPTVEMSSECRDDRQRRVCLADAALLPAGTEEGHTDDEQRGGDADRHADVAPGEGQRTRP